MQENNNGKEIRRGIQRYKVGDPILFNDLADSFFTKNKEQVPIIHNNMKGRIEDFRLLEAGKVTERIQFDIEIDKPLMNLDDKDLDFQVIGVSEKGNSIIRFEVCITKISTFLILCDLAVCLATLYVSFSLVFALMRYLQGKVFLIRFYSPTTLSSSRAEFRLPSRLACA